MAFSYSKSVLRKSVLLLKVSFHTNVRIRARLHPTSFHGSLHHVDEPFRSGLFSVAVRWKGTSDIVDDANFFH